jgi:hypothetical protein
VSSSALKLSTGAYLEYVNDDYDLVGYEGGAKPKNAFDRLAVLNDQFFYCFSIRHFAKLLQTSLRKVFKALDNRFTNGETVDCVVIGNKLAITFPTNAFDTEFRLVVNQPLKNSLGFHSVPHETMQGAFVFVVKKGILQHFGNSTKWVITENFRPTGMFPFKSVIFLSSNLRTRGVRRVNNSNAFPDAEAPIITDLLLLPETETDFYDTMNYSPQTYNRIMNLDVTNDVHQVHVSVMMETSDGYQIPVRLRPSTTCSILLKFDEN